MKSKAIIFGAVLLLLLAICPTFAVDTDKITINNSNVAGEVRQYKVDLTIKGEFPNPETKQPMNVDTAMSFKIRHQYNRRDKDGLASVEVSLVEGQVTMDGQVVTITPSMYPKITALLDKNYAITNLIGAEPAKEGALPGINYNNMLMLFYLPGPVQARSLGDTWKHSVNLSVINEAYAFEDTLKSLEVVDGVKAALVQQKIKRVQVAGSNAIVSHMTATADSYFVPSNGILKKSHVVCEVFVPSNTSSDASAKPSSVKIVMDISLIAK